MYIYIYIYMYTHISCALKLQPNYNCNPVLCAVSVVVANEL